MIKAISLKLHDNQSICKKNKEIRILYSVNRCVKIAL